MLPLILVIFLVSCDKEVDYIEKSGKVYNLFTKNGEPGVEVCAVGAKNCVITDVNGNFVLPIRSNEYLLNQDFTFDYSYQKENFSFEQDYSSSKVVAVPRSWVKLNIKPCLLYTSPSPRDRTRSRMPSSA